MKSKPFAVLAVLFLCVCPASALIEFNDGQTHNITYRIRDDVWVDAWAPPIYTTANWLDGGDIDWPYALCGYWHSRINVSGGRISSLYGYDSSQVTISGGSIDRWVSSYGSSRVYISGGSIGHHFSSKVSSHAYISGGSINGYLCSYDSSRVDISGGLIKDHLKSYDSSQVNITGGLIGDYLELDNQSKIQIFGYDFAVDGRAVDYGEITSIHGGWPSHEPTRHLTGTLLNGDLIDNDFYIGEDAKIILTIPEPGTVLLLGLGGLLLKRRRN